MRYDMSVTKTSVARYLSLSPVDLIADVFVKVT